MQKLLKLARDGESDQFFDWEESLRVTVGLEPLSKATKVYCSAEGCFKRGALKTCSKVSSSGVLLFKNSSVWHASGKARFALEE